MMVATVVSSLAQPCIFSTVLRAPLGEETLDALADETPLCRIGAPEEVADAVVFLAGEGASFITGQILSVNGGFGV